jgi:hypothetical protein
MPYVDFNDLLEGEVVGIGRDLTMLEREVIEKAIAFRKARLAGLLNMPMGNPNDREFQDRAIALLTACDSAQLELERAVDGLVEEREKR